MYISYIKKEYTNWSSNSLETKLYYCPWTKLVPPISRVLQEESAESFEEKRDLAIETISENSISEDRQRKSVASVSGENQIRLFSFGCFTIDEANICLLVVRTISFAKISKDAPEGRRRQISV